MSEDGKLFTMFVLGIVCCYSIDLAVTINQGMPMLVGVGTVVFAFVIANVKGI